MFITPLPTGTAVVFNRLGTNGLITQGHADHDYDVSVCMQACTQASLHAHHFMVCLDSYLCQIWSDQRYQGIY